MCSFPLRGLGRWGLFLLLLTPLGLSGCGASGSVSGKVSYKGTMLKGGTVTFHSPMGKASAVAQIGEDGSYTIEKVPAGDVKICVDTKMLDPGVKTAARTYG